MKIKRRYLRKLMHSTGTVLIKGTPIALDVATVVVPGLTTIKVAAKVGKILLNKRP